jgi:hypothetical protein
MKEIKFIHYGHNPYGDRLNSSSYSLVEGEEYIIEFGEWEGTGIARKVRAFKISGLFGFAPDWMMINDEGVGVPIPGIKTQHSLWFNDIKDMEFYDVLLSDIDKSCMIWKKLK